MIIFIIWIIILVYFITVVFLVIKHNNANVEKNKKYGKACVVGYSNETSGSYIELMVKVLDINDNHTYNLKGRYNVKNILGKKDERYPWFEVNDEINVIYTQKNIFGIKMLDVRLNEELYKKQ